MQRSRQWIDMCNNQQKSNYFFVLLATGIHLILVLRSVRKMRKIIFFWAAEIVGFKMWRGEKGEDISILST
jgi:hypothetical protein